MFLENDEIFKDLILTGGLPHSFYCFFFRRYLKNKKSSENDQVNWSFSELLFYLFTSPTLNRIFSPVNQLIKTFWPKSLIIL